MTGGPNVKQKDAHTIVTMQNQLYQQLMNQNYGTPNNH